MAPDPAAVTAWLEALVRAATPAATAVYLGRVPTGAKYPHVCVYAIPGGAVSGSLGAGNDQQTFAYQVDYVTRTHRTAQEGGLLVQEAVVGGATEADGVFICDRITDGAPGGVETEGDAPREVYTQQTRYAITATAA